MTYYVRYVIAEERGISLPELEAGLQTIDPAFAIHGNLVVLRDQEYGVIDITYPGDPIYEDDLELLNPFAEEKKYRQAILDTLRQAKCLVTVQAYFWTTDEKVFEGLEPLFEWLLEHRTGLTMVEGGYFYSRAGPLD